MKREIKYLYCEENLKKSLKDEIDEGSFCGPSD